MALLMSSFMAIATIASIANIALACRDNNKDAMYAWAVASLFALALTMNNIAAALK